MNDLTPMQQNAPDMLAAMADKYGAHPVAFEETIATVAMPRTKDGRANFSKAEMLSCLIVANEHDLNPLTKEIYFMRTKAGAVQPIVSVDGWIKKLNSHPQFDGLEFEDQLDDEGNVQSITCIVYRKDRSHPVRVTEYLNECKQDTGPWNKTPARMLRHRTLTQAARYAIGFAGVMDRDEFDQWQRSENIPAERVQTLPSPPDVPELPDIPDESQDPDPPLADEAGFIESLRDSVETAGTPDLVNEVREANEDLFSRCSDAGRAEIEEIFASALQ